MVLGMLPFMARRTPAPKSAIAKSPTVINHILKYFKYCFLASRFNSSLIFSETPLPLLIFAGSHPPLRLSFPNHTGSPAPSLYLCP